MQGDACTTAEREVVYLLDEDAALTGRAARLLAEAGYVPVVLPSEQALFEAGEPTPPACLLLSLEWRGPEGGVALQDQIARQAWVLPIVFLAGAPTISVTVKVLKAGAEDLLPKPVGEADLLEAVSRALARARRLRSERQERGLSRELLCRLSERESEVLSWVIAGCLNKQTASGMGISERTVKAHRSRIMDKLGVASLPDLVRMADKGGFVSRTQ